MAEAIQGSQSDGPLRDEIERAAAMPEKKASRFPRTVRLLRHADFERVYKQGRRHFSASMTVFYWPRPAEAEKANAEMRAGTVPVAQGLRIGFTVSRALGGAVQRNRMKRRLREAVRMSLPVAGVAADVVINPKKALLKIEFTAVLSEVQRAFAVIEQKLCPSSQRKALPEEAGNRNFASKRESGRQC